MPRLLSVCVSVLIAVIAQAQADDRWLTIDQVHTYTLEQPAASIVVGNPSHCGRYGAVKHRASLIWEASWRHEYLFL